MVVENNHILVFKEVYNPLTFISTKGESLQLCMRDGGFEFTYQGKTYEAKGGEVNELGPKPMPSAAEAYFTP
jgi:hypothetical protein